MPGTLSRFPALVLGMRLIRAKSYLSFLGLFSLVSIGLVSCSPAEVPSAEFTQQDVMFAEMMIPHHEQAVVMGNLALEKSTNPGVISLAQKIVDGQDAEILQMKAWSEGSAPRSDSSGMDHGAMGHNMPGGMGMMSGMVSEEDLVRLASLSSPDFDRLFLELMIAHHEGALEMVMMIEDSPNAEARELARAITTAQEQEIIEMRSLLEELAT